MITGCCIPGPCYDQTHESSWSAEPLQDARLTVTLHCRRARPWHFSDPTEALLKIAMRSTQKPQFCSPQFDPVPQANARQSTVARHGYTHKHEEREGGREGERDLEGKREGEREGREGGRLGRTANLTVK